MYSIDLRFRADYHDVTWFLGALFRNGQAIGTWPVITTDGTSYCCRLTVPTEDALDPSSDGHRVAEARKALWAVVPRIVGRDVEAPEVCDCTAPSARLLITTAVVPDPPVRCADCWGVLPLYRLPYPDGEQEHGSLRGWQESWRAFDRLWMGSAAGEGYSYVQLSDPRSPLARQGRGLCSELERLTGVPFYYFLMLYYGADPQHCPGCGHEWAWEDPVVPWIPHRCEPCRLVAQEGGKDDEIPDPSG